MPAGESAQCCDECGEPIPARAQGIARRAYLRAMPGGPRRQRVQSGINRRGSKDSQLR